jgi:hypothetical protein
MAARRTLLLAALAAVALLALAGGLALAHHGSAGDCQGLADQCVPSGAFASTLTNSNPAACRFDAVVTWGDGTSSGFTDYSHNQPISHQYTGHGVFQVTLTGTGIVRPGYSGLCTFTGATRTVEVPAPRDPSPAPPPAGGAVKPPPVTPGDSPAPRLPRVSGAPVRTALAGPDGAVTAPAPRVGAPTAAASAPLTRDQKEAVALILDRKDRAAVTFTLALRRGVSREVIRFYCLDLSFATSLGGLFTHPDETILNSAAALSVGAYCLRSLDRALRATGHEQLGLTGAAAACRVAPRLITLRRVSRRRIRVRTARAGAAAVRTRTATVTCAPRADGRLAIRVRSRRGVPLRSVVGPRLKIGFAQGRGAPSGPIEVRFGRR